MHVSSFIITSGTTEQRQALLFSRTILLKVALNTITIGFNVFLLFIRKMIFLYFFYVVELLIFDFDSKIIHFYMSYFPLTRAKRVPFMQSSMKITYIFFHNLFKILML